MVEPVELQRVGRLSLALRDTIFQSIQWVNQTGSTNADLVEAARSGAPNGSVLVSDHQSAGKGRNNRSWEDEPGSSLLVSILLRPSSVDPVGWLVSATAIALVDAVANLGVRAGIKWPNDVVIPTSDGYEKLAGILAESLVNNGRIDAVVIGFGCNVALVPTNANQAATSLEAQCGETVDREKLLIEVLRRVDKTLLSPGLLIDAYRERSATIGNRVRVELVDRVLFGQATDIDNDGRLIVATDFGEEIVSAGDVVHLRPAETSADS